MFNALKYSKDLEAAGFSREQAEATIDVFFKFMEHNFATKEDINSLRGEVREAINGVRLELNDLRTEMNGKMTGIQSEFSQLKHEFQSLEQRMTIKFGLMQTAGIAFLAALIKLF